MCVFMKKTNRMAMNILQNFLTFDGNKHVSGGFENSNVQLAPPVQKMLHEFSMSLSVHLQLIGPSLHSFYLILYKTDLCLRQTTS